MPNAFSRLARSRMPCQSVDALLMAVQLHDGLMDCAEKALLGDQPHLGKTGKKRMKSGESTGRGNFGSGIFRAGGDHVVIEWGPMHFQTRGLMSVHKWYFLKRENVIKCHHWHWVANLSQFPLALCQSLPHFLCHLWANPSPTRPMSDFVNASSFVHRNDQERTARAFVDNCL